MPVRRRTTVLVVGAFLGGVLYLPFMAAAVGLEPWRTIGFLAVVTLVASAAAFSGLRLADSVGLPMPHLRALERGERVGAPRGAVSSSIGLGLLLGLVGLAVLLATGAPSPEAELPARVLSTIFAATVLEIVIHLFFMSLIVRLTNGSTKVGILGSGALLAVFHLVGGGGAGALLVVAGVVTNGAAGVAFGWLYARYGFEYAMLGHAVAHLIAVAPS